MKTTDVGHADVPTVLFLYRVCGLGGVETSLLTKIQAIERAGFRASALFYRYWGEGGKKFAEATRFFRVEESYEGQVRAIKEARPSAIVLVDSPEFLPAIYQAGIGCPVYFESHASYVPSLDAYPVQLAGHALAGVIVPSRFNSGNFQSILPGVPVTVIPNAIDVARFASTPAGSPPAWFLPSGGPAVVFIGRLEPEKNALSFVRIAERLLCRIPSVRFIVIGDAVDTPEYLRAVELAAHAVGDHHFTFVPRVAPANMPFVYAMAARSGGCLVSASLNESQPMVILEAMAAGCPVVSTDVGGVSEIVRDGETGRLFPVDDDAKGAELVIEVLAGEQQSSSIIARAREYVVKQHSLALIAEKYAALFRSPSHTILAS
jgi:glycosyltransferase involved in cell wall biosynthesis